MRVPKPEMSTEVLPIPLRKGCRPVMNATRVGVHEGSVYFTAVTLTLLNLLAPKVGVTGGIAAYKSAELVRRLATEAYLAIDCAGMARAPRTSTGATR